MNRIPKLDDRMLNKLVTVCYRREAESEAVRGLLEMIKQSAIDNMGRTSDEKELLRNQGIYQIITEFQETMEIAIKNIAGGSRRSERIGNTLY